MPIDIKDSLSDQTDDQDLGQHSEVKFTSQ
jgi:hypothetical protein